LKLDRREEKAHHGGGNFGEVVIGGGGSGMMQAKPLVVLGDGEEHQMMRRSMASSAVVGSSLGDDGVKRWRGRGGGGIGWSTLPVFQGCSSSEECVGRCRRAMEGRWWDRTATRWSEWSARAIMARWRRRSSGEGLQRGVGFSEGALGWNRSRGTSIYREGVNLEEGADR
jgi:hypothetical protein